MDINEWFVTIASAVCWSLVIGFYYRRSWGLEHGVGMSAQDRLFGRDSSDTDTQVYISPLWIPCLFVIRFIIFTTQAPFHEGIRLFFLDAVNYMLILSVLYAVLLVLLPLLRRYVSARSCATVWLLPVFSSTYINLYHSSIDRAVLSFFMRIPMAVTYLLISLWAAGFFILFLRCIISHLRLRHLIARTASEETDERIADIWQEEQRALGFVTPVRLVRTSMVHAPFSIGHTKKTRMCVLPIRAYSERELRMIFRHELHHLRRHDTDSKLFFCFCGALCWFNPLIWIALRQAASDLELSCDEIVLEQASADDRTFYAELLLTTAGERRGFTTCLSVSAASLRYRLKQVIHARNTSEGTIMLMVLMFVFVFGIGLMRWL